MYFFVDVADPEPGAMKARRVETEDLHMRVQTAGIGRPSLNSLIDARPVVWFRRLTSDV